MATDHESLYWSSNSMALKIIYDTPKELERANLQITVMLATTVDAL